MKIITFLLVFTFSVYVPAQGRRRVVCYFTDWAGYRNGDGKFTPQDLDASKCTNVLYAFALLDTDSVNIKPADSWADISLNYYNQVVAVSKAANAKPSLALGGWTDSAGNKYSVLFNDPSKRKQFVQNTVNYLQKYGFEGLDLDVEYPTCPQGDCNSGNPNDKQGFAALIQELSQAFKPKGWVLSAAISADPGKIDRGYDINAMNQYLDWIGVMTYDYHSSSGSQTGPVSPLKTAPGDKFPNSNTEKTVNYMLSKGANKNKLLIGMPFYGYSYNLQNPSNNGYWASSNGQGQGGPFTNAPGQMAYYEICDLIKQQGYTNVENANLGAYTYKGNNWISYNSQQDAINKANYVKSMNLGGIIIWDASFDDFRGKFCGLGKNPLLTALKNNIG